MLAIQPAREHIKALTPLSLDIRGSRFSKLRAIALCEWQEENMPLSLDPEIPLDSISTLKTFLHGQGYSAKVMLDGPAMDRVTTLVTADKHYQLTPPEELRYIEGLLDLPLGFLKEFGFIPSDETQTCVCGRTPSALDVVHTALSQGIHAKSLIRDTLIGPHHIFEMSATGRDFACASCGNRLVMKVYSSKRKYLYA